MPLHQAMTSWQIAEAAEAVYPPCNNYFQMKAFGGDFRQLLPQQWHSYRGRSHCCQTSAWWPPERLALRCRLLFEDVYTTGLHKLWDGSA